MIYVIATLKAHPGKAGQVIEAAGPCVAGTRAEAGCLYYDLYRKTDDPDGLVFVEGWETRAHLSAHGLTPHIAAFREATSDLVASAVVEVVHPEKVEVL